LISQVVPQLVGVKQWCDGKNKSVHTRLSRAYLALARLSCDTSNTVAVKLSKRVQCVEKASSCKA